MQNEEIHQPLFMVDETESDGSAEPIIDYVLSWCIRRADERCSKEKPILYNQCRQILGTLLEISVTDNVVFHNVKVWKQWMRIDLSVELDVEIDGKVTKHAILIENKYYAGLREIINSNRERKNQLEAYKEIFEAHYKLEESKGRNWEKHYALVTCIKNEDPKFAIYNVADNFGFKKYYIKELLGEKNADKPLSESDLFNEFWYRWGDANF